MLLSRAGLRCNQVGSQNLSLFELQVVRCLQISLEEVAVVDISMRSRVWGEVNEVVCGIVGISCGDGRRTRAR